MRVIAQISAIVVVAVGTMPAQVMLERALLTSGVSSVAGSSAKKAGEGISSVLSRVNGTLQSAASTGTTATSTPVQPAVETPEVPQVRGTAANSWATAPAYRQPALAPLPEASMEALAKVEAGTSRQDLVTKIGRPTSRISIPEEGQLLEVYQYWSRGVVVASVRLTNGTVSSVDIRHP